MTAVSRNCHPCIARERRAILGISGLMFGMGYSPIANPGPAGKADAGSYG